MPDEILQKYITVHPNRTVSLSEFSFFKLAFAFADQNPPGSGTFEFVRWPFLELKTFFLYSLEQDRILCSGLELVCK